MEFRYVMQTSTLYCTGHHRHTGKDNEFYLENFIQMPSIKERRPYTQDSNLASHTIYTVFGSFTHELWELQFKAGVERWICYLAILFIFEIFAKTLLRESRRRNIFFIIRSVIDVRPRERNEHHLILVQ